MCSKELRADYLMLWPTAEIAVMGAESAASVIFKKEIGESPDPQATRKQRIEEYRAAFSTPLAAARRGYADMVIDPQNSRREIIKALENTATKKASLPYKKHSNLPL
jgi:acetyl-CoA carboxylase carboxyltransferase component